MNLLLKVFTFKCRVLESACKDDEELRAVLGDSIGNPELMRKKVSPLYMCRGLLLQRVSFLMKIWHTCSDVHVFVYYFVQVEERVRKKGKAFQKQKTGSVLSFKVSFRE